MYIYIINGGSIVGYRGGSQSKKCNTLAIITDNIYYHYTKSSINYVLIVAVVYNVREELALLILE